MKKKKGLGLTCREWDEPWNIEIPIQIFSFVSYFRIIASIKWHSFMNWIPINLFNRLFMIVAACKDKCEWISDEYLLHGLPKISRIRETTQPLESVWIIAPMPLWSTKKTKITNFTRFNVSDPTDIFSSSTKQLLHDCCIFWILIPLNDFPFCIWSSLAPNMRTKFHRSTYV